LAEGEGVEELRQKLKERAAAQVDVVGLGECSVDEVWMVPSRPAWGSKLHAERREQLGGGQVATAMVAAARLGLSAAYLGAVGDDLGGRLVLDGLAAERVDVSHVRVVTGGATRSALILVDGESGERTVVEHLDKRVHIPHDQIDGAAIARARVLHLDATQIATSREAARIARAHGVLVSIDVDHVRPGLDELLELVDICVTSESVPHQVTGERDLEQALRKLAARTGPFVACTLGPRGAAALDDGHMLLSPAFDVPVVDTTACGDTFHAAVIAALLDGQAVGDTLRFANAAAGLKCRDLGRRGCPTRAEVKTLLARA
jgi:sugar/nucleoside kinase (ribokinase family)